MNWQEPSDINNTVQISARRFEDSPYVALYETDKILREVYARRFFPVYNQAAICNFEGLGNR